MRTSRSNALLMLVALVVLAPGPSRADRRSRHVAEDPTIVALDLEARPGRGIAPLTVVFEAVRYAPGIDRVARVEWDFDDDGLADATGFRTEHCFETEGLYRVVATVVTREHGAFRRAGSVRVHSAMMTLTFDDGHVTQYLFARPTLAARGLFPTAYIVTDWIGWREAGTNSNYMSWEELGVLQHAGWDIGSHTVSHPHLPACSAEQVAWELGESRRILREHAFPARHFAVPHGDCNEAVACQAMEYYESNRATGNAVNPHPDLADPSHLTVKGTNWFKTIEEYRGYVDEAVDGGGWLILNNHIVLPECGQTSYCVEQAMLDAILDHAESRGVGFGSIEEVLSGAWEASPLPFEPCDDGAIVAEVILVATEPGPPGLRVTRARVGSGAEVVVRVGKAGAYRLTVHDVTGRLVAVLADGGFTGGERSLRWGERDTAGRAVGSGVYYVRLRGREGAAVAPIVVVR